MFVSKKLVRDNFRNKTTKRDKSICVMCGYNPIDSSELDAHHITSRDIMPFGGYCIENGITLCTDRSRKEDCHNKAEKLHSSGFAFLGYTPDDLYAKINSSYEKAYRNSLLLELTKSKVDDIFSKIEKVSKLEKNLFLDSVNPDTWILTCEELKEKNSLILGYGKGRYVQTVNKRTKGNN